ncbi:MAG: GNAT family N-acetyltransferase [bacterium]|nr:GNAT family N-acetyltransferase [bacterium]
MSRPEFEFEALAEHHLPLLFDWLNRPHVAEFWDGPVSLEEVREKYLPRIGSTSIDTRIALLDGTPVGFIQSYAAVEPAEEGRSGEQARGVVGIDQFLADAGNLGKGLGTEMVRQFVRLLFRNPTVTSIQTDPAPGNLRAIRCYEKVGFRKLGPIETSEGPALLMVIGKPAL